MRKVYFTLLISVLVLLLAACGANTAGVSQDGQKVSALKSPYWVENDVRLVSGDGEIVFEDNEGICCPLLSGDGKYMAYSNGGSSLFLYTLSNGKKKTIYELKDADSIDYRVYPAGWSPDSKRVALMTSSNSGFIGGNELIIVDIGSRKASIVTKCINSADWGSDGQLIIADSSDVNIIDEMGRIQKKLNTPPTRAFFRATNPAFSTDGKLVVYSCGDTYYLHDIEKDEYNEIFSVRGDSGPARISKDGKVIVADKGEIYVYDPSDKSYKVLYDKAKSGYPNW